MGSNRKLRMMVSWKWSGSKVLHTSPGSNSDCPGIEGFVSRRGGRFPSTHGKHSRCRWMVSLGCIHPPVFASSSGLSPGCFAVRSLSRAVLISICRIIADPWRRGFLFSEWTSVHIFLLLLLLSFLQIHNLLCIGTERWRRSSVSTFPGFLRSRSLHVEEWRGS